MSDNQDEEFGTTHVVCILIFVFVLVILIDMYFTHGSIRAGFIQIFTDMLQAIQDFVLNIILTITGVVVNFINRMLAILLEPLGTLLVIVLLIPMVRSFLKKPSPPAAKKKGGAGH